MEGNGSMVTTGVGLNSQAGAIYALMKSNDNDKTKSDLQDKLAELALEIGYFG